MAFFDFTLPASDGSGLTNESFLNDNWDKLDTRLIEFQKDPNEIAAPIPIGTEALVNGSIQVWDGTAWNDAVDIDSAWNSWQLINLNGSSSIIERGGYEPIWKVNTALRQVIITGGVYYNSAADPWPAGVYQISSDTAGIPIQYAPAEEIWAGGGASQSQSGNGTDYAGSRVSIWPNGNWVGMSVQHQGLYDGGGNFIMLDGIGWFY